MDKATIEQLLNFFLDALEVALAKNPIALWVFKNFIRPLLPKLLPKVVTQARAAGLAAPSAKAKKAPK